MGRAIALALAEAGANVAIGSLLSNRDKRVDGELAYLPGESELEEVGNQIESLGVRAFAAGLDVPSDESVEIFHCSAVEALGEIDILGNAAGITAEQTLCGHSDSLWQKVIDVNLNGIYRTARRCLPRMIERGWGRVINIASVHGLVASVNKAPYVASKFGVVGRVLISLASREPIFNATPDEYNGLGT